MKRIRNILIPALTAAAFLALGILMTSRSTRLQAKISVLEGRNQELEKMYQKLDAEAGRMRDSLKSGEERISMLAQRDSSLAVKNRNLRMEEELAQQRANNTLSEERIRLKDSSISELTLKGQTLERLVRNREDAVANLNSRIENLDKSINLYKKAQRRQRSYKWFAGAVGVAAGILIGKL
jgi:chromosome segregation ATPase